MSNKLDEGELEFTVPVVFNGDIIINADKMEEALEKLQEVSNSDLRKILADAIENGYGSFDLDKEEIEILNDDFDIEDDVETPSIKPPSM